MAGLALGIVCVGKIVRGGDIDPNSSGGRYVAIAVVAGCGIAGTLAVLLLSIRDVITSRHDGGRPIPWIVSLYFAGKPTVIVLVWSGTIILGTMVLCYLLWPAGF